MGMNSFIFGDVNSVNYGVWLTGSGTFSAPERDVEMVPVPGRNGDLIIDNGRWNNITVTYPANIPHRFDDKFSAFRSDMCRQRGYQRLEDTYHPDEYRLASFSDGLIPETIPLNRGGEFDITFNCKPQRFLKAGDIPIQIMPIMPTGSTLYTRFIPVGAETLDLIIRCKETDTLTVYVSTFDSDKEEIDITQYSCTDGDMITYTFTASDVYWRIIVSGQTDTDAINITVKTTTLYDSKPLSINALFGRTFWLQNPTGYACTPMIEVYNNVLSSTTIENYGESGNVAEYYQFQIAATNVDHFFMDCDMQYLYDESKNNLTNKLTITTAQSDVGKALVFPELGGGKIKIYTTLNTGTGLGIVNIYPHWWRL